MVAHSTDGGLTWPAPAVYLNQGQGGSDKEWTAVDTNPSSPYYHRVYTTWTNFAAGPAFIEKWSSDSGVTWNPAGGSNYVTVSFGAYDSGQFSMPVTLPNGNVIATWNTRRAAGRRADPPTAVRASSTPTPRRRTSAMSTPSRRRPGASTRIPSTMRQPGHRHPV